MLSSIIPKMPRQERTQNPGYMPSGLAFSKDVYHRKNHKDSNQATMINMGMESGRMLKESDNQSSCKATAKIDRKTAAAASTFRRGDEYPYDSDSDTAYHFSYFVQDGLEARDRIMPLNARLANAPALRAASAVKYCDHLQSPCMMPCFLVDFSQMQTFTWTGRVTFQTGTSHQFKFNQL